MIIGLCDDDIVQLNYIKSLIIQWADNNKISCDIKLFRSAEELLFEHSVSFPFDLLILDIQMGNMNGMDLAKKIRMVDNHIPILFLTGLTDYVYEGYEVGALRYLIKPVKEEQLIKVLDGVLLGYIITPKKYYIFSYEGETIKLDLDDIICMEALGHYLKLVTDKRVYQWKESISNVRKALDSSDFIPTHRSFLVNLKYVDKINKTDCLLSGGMMVPISRSNYQLFNRAFIDYYRRDLQND